MNIISNAADAIVEAAERDNPVSDTPARGRIDIRTELRREGEDGVPHYVFTISDTGPGVAPEVQERIFEPFFTTKPVGAGTGLGLAIAYGVVQAHQGTLTVANREHGGAQFTISVPWRAQDSEDGHGGSDGRVSGGQAGQA
ncbi:hypothetical protein LDL36_01330 [Komagataeibacter sp. FNDCR1]|nr:hypothetical protein [Komagataeibacter sp. FNDCR1]